MIARYTPQSNKSKSSTPRVRQFRRRQQKKHELFVASLAENKVPAVTDPAPLPVATERAHLTNIETSLADHGLRRSPRPSITISAATFVSALALASCSAYFSISGLTAIFAGAYWPVVGMGAALEAGKMSAVAWLGQRFDTPPLRMALMVLVAVLMALNAVGVYGYLSRAHIAHALAGDLAVAGRAADVHARIDVKSNTVADLDKRIAQIDSAIDEATKRGRTVSAMTLADQQRRNRSDLVVARQHEAKALAALQVETVGIDGERKTVEADLGPVRFLAAFIGANDEAVMRFFILAVALLLDPAAVLLLLAATTAAAKPNPIPLASRAAEGRRIWEGRQ